MNVTIKNVGFEKIYDPYEIVTNFGTTSETDFIVHNNNADTITSCILYISKTENLGDLDNPGTLEPYIDIEHIIQWGNEKTSDPNYIGFVAIVVDGTEYIVNSAQCNSKKNGIEVGPLVGGEQKTISIKVEVPASLASRRLFVNLVAE